MAAYLPDPLICLMRDTILAVPKREGPDRPIRQLGVLLVCYLTDEPQTVRGLAAKLNISRPAITRALDRLRESDLIWRRVDPLDRRSIVVERTVSGGKFMRDLTLSMVEAKKAIISDW